MAYMLPMAVTLRFETALNFCSGRRDLSRGIRGPFGHARKSHTRAVRQPITQTPSMKAFAAKSSVIHAVNIGTTKTK